MKTRTLRQSITFKVSPHEVYEALMDSRQHAKFTGAKAKISRAVGGKISAYDDYVDGVNLELLPDRRVVQLWRGIDWPEGHYSTATFSLKEVAGVTHLTFTQTEVPEEQYESIRQGWHDNYWQPMKRYLEGQTG